MSEKHSAAWPHKDLLDVEHLSTDELATLLDTAKQMFAYNQEPVKKHLHLKGKGIILFFAENSTRTKTSFDIAGKRLSADTFSVSSQGSSIQKGESLSDTALTLDAMDPDVIVLRHSKSGAAKFIAERVRASVVNAGDGWHSHPTQALLDYFTLHQKWGDDFKGKTVTIVGDVAHSRVARSNIHLLSSLGVNLRVCAPKTLLPAGIEHWPVEVYKDLYKATKESDAVICLRLQLERMAAGLIPHLDEYSQRFCLDHKHLQEASPDVHVLHPGPIMRGVDVTANLADSKNSRILDQVASGVAIRMAILYLLVGDKSLLLDNNTQEGGK